MGKMFRSPIKRRDPALGKPVWILVVAYNALGNTSLTLLLVIWKLAGLMGLRASDVSKKKLAYQDTTALGVVIQDALYTLK